MEKNLEKKTPTNDFIHCYDESKPINIIFNKEINSISEKSNVNWVVWENNKPTFKPMRLSQFLKYGNYNGKKVLNYVITKGKDAKNGFTIFRYDKGVYKKTSADEFKGAIRKFIPQDLRNRKLVDEVYADLISEDLFIDEFQLNSAESYINFEDGIFDLKSKTLLPHSPEYLSTIQIPAKYKEIESAPDIAPVFDKYIHTLCDNDEDAIEILMECIGLAISNVYGYRTKKALFLVGKGDSGKSQIKKLAETFIGINNISTADLKNINSRFGKSALYGKRLVGCNDMSYEAIKEMDIFKQITGGDNISIEFKNGDFIDYTYKGFCWFNCNNMPAFGGDKGKWVYDRMIPIACVNSIPKEKQDPKLFDKMYLERNTILKRCLQALYRLIDNNYNIELTENMKKMLNTYEIENNTLLTFISECCVDSSDVSTKTKRSTFNKCYSNWCKIYNDNKGKVGNNTIKKLLSEKYDENFKLSGGIWYMDKLAIKPEILNELGVYDTNDTV